MAGTVDARLAELGIELPAASAPAANQVLPAPVVSQSPVADWPGAAGGN